MVYIYSTIKMMHGPINIKYLVLFPVISSQSYRHETWLSRESHSLMDMNKGKTRYVLGKASLNHLERNRVPMLNVAVLHTAFLPTRWRYNFVRGRQIISERCTRKQNDPDIGLLTYTWTQNYRCSKEGKQINLNMFKRTVTDSFSCTLYDQWQFILGRTENTLWRQRKPGFF